MAKLSISGEGVRDGHHNRHKCKLLSVCYTIYGLGKLRERSAVQMANYAMIFPDILFRKVLKMSEVLVRSTSSA